MENLKELDKRIENIEHKITKVAALNKEEEFSSRFIISIKNELTSYISKIVLGGIVLIGGAGFIFVQHAVNESFKNENELLIKRLEGEYQNAIDGIEEKFEWRRYHDYGKNYIYISELLNETNIPDSTKRNKTIILFDKAASKFKQALNHKGNHGSTYYELAELEYSYPKKYSITSLINERRAIQLYNKCLPYYLPSEISKGWRGDAFFKIGQIYAEMSDNKGLSNDLKLKHIEMSRDFLVKARNDYSSASEEAQLSPRIKQNSDKITALLSNFK